MEAFMTPAIWVSFFTLFALELVLGIDNIIFISILAGKLPKEQQNKARVMGLSLAVITRLILLMSLSWIITLTEPIFNFFGQGISGRDLILILGGLFLIGKSTLEISHKLEGEEGSQSNQVAHSFHAVIIQILLLDIVFSLDSVITAVGMVTQLSVMVAAVLASTAVMLFSAKSISDFVDRHPSLKILALSFLLMIGLTLIVEGFDQHVPKGYIYFAMAFSVFVELLNIKMRSKKKIEPVKLRERIAEDHVEAKKS
ncbi:MAG: TerC family protein [Bdellovibrionales bacterium]|nr:TerC family protein [Bdellovibrionales bacterium]